MQWHLIARSDLGEEVWIHDAIPKVVKPAALSPADFDSASKIFDNRRSPSQGVIDLAEQISNHLGTLYEGVAIAGTAHFAYQTFLNARGSVLAGMDRFRSQGVVPADLEDRARQAAVDALESCINPVEILIDRVDLPPQADHVQVTGTIDSRPFRVTADLEGAAKILQIGGE